MKKGVRGTGYMFLGNFVHPQSYTEWEAHGLILLTGARDRNGHEIGEWYNFAVNHYPRGLCKRIITSPAWRDKIGKAYQYCKNCGLTERRFPGKYRQQYPSLWFGHFVEVNACDPELAELLLALAVTYGWTTSQLREEVRRHRNGYYSTPTTDVVRSLADLILRNQRFSVILVDPPWKFDDPGVRGGNGIHYPPMELDAIRALKITDVAADDCTLFMWVPQSFLEEGLATMRAWDFRYARCAIWHKEPGSGTGYYTRCCHEVLLVGHRGKPPIWAGDFPSVIEAPRRCKHSAKPAIFHQVIEKALGGLDRLELFARRQRKGWVCVGNQLEPVDGDDVLHDEIYPSCDSLKRVHCMPSAETFTMKPVHDLLTRWIAPEHLVVDPFARNTKWGTHTNDLNTGTTAQHHMDAIDFLVLMKGQGLKFDRGLFDAVYSPRQLAECYQGIGRALTQTDTQSFGRNVRDGIDAVIKPGGIVISFGWSSVGMGKQRGYQLIDGLVVCHGGDHHATIVTVEQKVS